MKIPEIWKKNLNFNNTFSKILNKDQNFKEYYKNIILSGKENNNNNIESFNSKITKENHKIVRETSLPQIIHKRKAIKKNFNELTSSARSTLSLNQNLTTSYLTNSSFQNKTSFTQEFNQSDKKEKLIDPKINKKTRNNDLLSPFLNVLRIDKKIEIKNPTVKKMLMETKNHGPYYTHCPSCHNKNLNFFQHLKENEAVKILSFIQKDISAS